MEGSVFPAPAVAAVLKDRYVEARLHTDGGPAQERNNQLKAELSRSAALPVYVLYDPAPPRKVAEREGYVLKGSFVEFLETK
jgi:hypothetical protein